MPYFDRQLKKEFNRIKQIPKQEPKEEKEKDKGIEGPNYNREKDTEQAKKAEIEFGKILEKKGWKNIQFNNDYKWDIQAEKDGMKKTWEVKQDFTCQKTGNVGLEFEHEVKKGMNIGQMRPSGISTTLSDFHAFKIHEPSGQVNWYMLRTSDIKNLIKNKVYHKEIWGGDEKKSHNYLFKFNDFIQNGKASKIFIPPDGENKNESLHKFLEELI